MSSCANVGQGEAANLTLSENRGLRVFWCRTRQIKELEFQIVLPGIPGAPRSPLKPQRSGRPRKTPQAELVPRRSSRRTPKPTQLQSQTSSRRTPARGRKKKVEKTLTSEPATIEDHITVLNSARTQSDGEGVTTKKRKFSIQEDAEASGDLNNSGTKTNLETSQNIGEAQNENIQSNSTQAPVEEVQGRKGKKRKSIVQVSRKKLKTELHPNDHNIEMPTRAGSLGPTDAEPEVSAPPFDANVIEEPQNVAVLSNSESQESNQDLDQALGGKKDEQDLTLIPPKPQAQAKPKRKKRRSIGQAQKPRRKATEALKPKIPTQVSKKKNVGAGSGVRTVKPGALATTVYATEARSRGRPKKIEIAINTENDHDGIHNVRDDHSETRAPQARRRGRPKKQLAAISEESQADENDIEASEKSGTKDLSTNSRRGRPKRDAQSNKSLLDRNTTKEKAKRKPKAPTKTKPSAIRQPPKNTIPVTVYRLSSAQAPDEDEANIDSLANPPLFKNNSVNAVDVLSQVCREIISKSSDTVHRTIKQEPSKPQKAELERRREIIDMYGEELDNRLFQLVSVIHTAQDPIKFLY